MSYPAVMSPGSEVATTEDDIRVTIRECWGLNEIARGAASAEWVGRGAEALGLTGPVDPAEAARTLERLQGLVRDDDQPSEPLNLLDAMSEDGTLDSQMSYGNCRARQAGSGS
jgi:hypothetical protein